MRSLLIVLPLILLLLLSSAFSVDASLALRDTDQQEIKAEADAVGNNNDSGAAAARKAAAQQKSRKRDNTDSSFSSSSTSGGRMKRKHHQREKDLAEKVKKAVGDKIKHIIVLMEENRSYDHLMGFYGQGNGLTGNEYNLKNPLDLNSPRVYVSNGTTYVNPGDPDHSVNGTTKKLWGPKKWAEKDFTTPPTMEGFVWEEATLANDYSNGNRYPYDGSMQMFSTKRQLPVFSALAENYLSFDRFFAGMPGPTWPNRQFFMSATSNGLSETFYWYNSTPGLLYPQKTIFDQVDEAGASWKVYYEDTPWELFMESLAHNPEHLHSMDQFFEDCETGDLPHFSYLNPRSGINITTGVGSNDEHPDHDVALAEAHYKRVYEAIRASPVWNETLFIITYDEHGGFYDHVPPPMNVPAPRPNMNLTSYPDAFNFDRLGVRMPTLLISPWVEKGTIISGPPDSQKPTPTSEYDTTSIMASIRKIIKEMEGMPALTGRDAWVATWEHVFENVTTPRTDCPMKLPDAPAPTLTADVEAAKKVNSLQQHIMTFHAGLHGKDETIFEHIQKQGQVSQWVLDSYHEHRHRTLAWKNSKNTTAIRNTPSSAVDTVPVLGLQNLKSFKEPITGQQWLLNRMPGMTGSGKMTLSLRWVNTTDNSSTMYCLDGGVGQVANNALTISHCYPVPEPVMNRDHDQWWTLHKDATLRPFQAGGGRSPLCVTNRLYATNQTDLSLFLGECVAGEVTQHYAYHGFDGNGFPGQLVFGDGAWFISVYLLPGGGGPTL